MRKLFQFAFLFLFVLGFSQKVEKLPLRKYKLVDLPEELKETSGLDFFENQLYTFNDSGNSSELFQIDKKTGVIEKVIPTNLHNRDWEALANDGQYLYIGDFGNNGGTRKDLTIYQIPIKEEKVILDSIQNIPFYYPEQKDFIFKNLANDYDAEALIFTNDQLHIFTKEWISKGVSHYILEVKYGEVAAAKKSEYFPTGFVVTDAAYFKNTLYLVGYTKKLKVFLQIFEETSPGIFFQGKSKKYKLGNALKVGQIEGIAVDESGIYITGEQFLLPMVKVKPQLYFIPSNIIKL